MKKPIVLLFIGLCLLSLIACSKQEDSIVSVEVANPIRMELEQVIVEKDIVEIWAVNAETCSSITSYDGTEDYEFMEHFVRVVDKYFRYERLVSFETDTRANGNQMLLCFN